MSQPAKRKAAPSPQERASPKEAAAEVLAGQPGPNARVWLGPLTLVVWVLPGLVRVRLMAAGALATLA